MVNLWHFTIVNLCFKDVFSLHLPSYRRMHIILLCLLYRNGKSFFLQIDCNIVRIELTCKCWSPYNEMLLFNAPSSIRFVADVCNALCYFISVCQTSFPGWDAYTWLTLTRGLLCVCIVYQGGRGAYPARQHERQFLGNGRHWALRALQWDPLRPHRRKRRFTPRQHGRP